MFPNTIDLKLMVDDVRRAYERKGFRARTFPFSYCTPEVGPVTDNVIRTATLETDRDSLFIWCGITATLRDTEHGINMAAGASIFSGLEVLGKAYKITGAQLAPWTSYTGAGLMPHVFGFPLILVPGERVRASWVNVEETFDRAFMALLGAKLFTTPYTRDLIYPDHDEAIVFPEKAAS